MHHLKLYYLGYRPPKFPREVLKEEDLNDQDLGGCYQDCLFCCGNCLSSYYSCSCGLAAICCVPSSFVSVETGTVGLYQRFGVYAKTVGAGLK